MFSKEEFRKIYNDNSQNLVGHKSNDNDVDEEYQNYLTIVDLVQDRNGTIIFKKDDQGHLDWNLCPSR